MTSLENYEDSKMRFSLQKQSLKIRERFQKEQLPQDTHTQRAVNIAN